MPTVLRSGGYRLYFFSHEPNEPPHVHVDRGGATAKVWLEPIRLARNIGFDLVSEHRSELLEAWHEFFGDRR